MAVNFNHLPAGRPDGGQFTFAEVGGVVMPTSAPIDPGYSVAPAESIPEEVVSAMQDELFKVGVSRQELIGEMIQKHRENPFGQEEFNRLFTEVIRNRYYTDVVCGRIGTSLQVEMSRNQEALANGGIVKALSKDDGSYQIVHSTNDSVAMYLDNLTDLREGEAAVYNPKTGRLRVDARIVPIPGTSLLIGANRTPQSIRNGLNQAATNGPRRAKKASKLVNKRITDATTAEGRQISSGGYAGRIGVCVSQDSDGNLMLQNCIICETNEGAIAEMYAKELGTDVLKASRPDDKVINAEPGSPDVRHEGNIYIGESDFGGAASGVANDTGKRAQVSPEAAQNMFKHHDEMQKQREEEYKKAHNGKDRPVKTDEQRQHEAYLRKRRAMRKKAAEGTVGLDDEAIRLKGGGYIFPGETIKRGGREYTYDDIKSGSTVDLSGVPRSTRKEVGNQGAQDAMTSEKRRQNIKLGNKNRKQQQRAREEAIRKANAEGRSAVTYREGKDKASGKTVLLFEGDPGYQEALKYKTAKTFPAK